MGDRFDYLRKHDGGGGQLDRGGADRHRRATPLPGRALRLHQSEQIDELGGERGLSHPDA
jgi:hypothetical protein